MSEFDKELDWDDVIEKENDFTLLPEGDYDFTVTAFERARHEGSDNIPPCKKAIVSIHIDSPKGSTTIKHYLFLHSKCEGKLSAFFIGIGQKKPGEPLRMNWNNVIGAKGRCHVYIDNWKHKVTGEDMQSNKIRKFYEPSSAQAVPQTPASSQAGVFTPGKF